uniref:Uncharacterized protein n=1 Tax=Desertifilum tharense IPPAS B-1220 TaxID=1781255 RepID=A0ACD5GQM4_9CYAN
MRFPKSWLLLSLPISLLFPAWMGFAAVSPQLPRSPRVDSRMSLEFPPPPNRGAPRSTAGEACAVRKLPVAWEKGGR